MPSRQASQRTRTRRTHILGGCENCRKRHTKCDQARPECLMCTSSQLKCQGYESNVQWIPEDGNSAPQEKMGTRAHLYTEEARDSMSTNMTQHFKSKTIDSALAEIDSWPRSDEPSEDCGMVMGPFGVLDITSQAIPPATSTSFNNNIPACPPSPPVGDTVSFNDTVSGVLPDGTPSMTTPSTFDNLTGIPDHLDWADLFNLDVQNLFSPELDDINISGTSDQEAFHKPVDEQLLAPTQSTSPIWSPLTEALDEVLDKEVPALIQHFDAEVISAIASLPFNLKSPYKILNVAAAVQTYADLTYLHRPVKHASLANLYGLLACSSQHLATNPSGSGISKSLYWQTLASSAGQKAKEHLQKSLRDELDGPNKAKYKDQVMALMNLLALAIAAGNQRDARCYMIDIERLLRLRGLPKRSISRRARLLHHMYTWNRIVGESTYVLHDGNSGTAAFTRTIPRPQTNNVARLDDFLRIDHSDDHDMGMTETDTEADVALRDVHLQDARQNPNTMYLQIYGVPETWLSLLSQTTRLANMKTMLEKDTRYEMSLQKRISRLEDMICAFASNYANDRAKTGTLPAHFMLQALSSALVIFFYRRILDVNALILQSHVDDVINSLRCFDDSLVEYNLKGPGTAWPAFIAGCEAATPSRQEPLLKWIESAYWRTGSHSFQSAKSMMEDVWQRRDLQACSPATRRRTNGRTSTLTATWVHICREKHSWVVLS